MAQAHSFSVEIAVKYDERIAIVLQHFSFWYIKNQSDGVNYFKNNTWVRMKLDSLHQNFPYLKPKQLYYLIDKMIELDLLIKDEFNNQKNDRTKWYTLTDNAKILLNIWTSKNGSQPQNWTSKNGSLTSKNGNSIYKEVVIESSYIIVRGEKIDANKLISENESLLEVLAMQQHLKKETILKTIPTFILHAKSLEKTYDNNADVFAHFASWIRKQNLKDADVAIELKWFIEMFNTIGHCNYLATDEVRSLFIKQLNNGFTGKQMAVAVQNLFSSSDKNHFHKNNNFETATPMHLLTGDNLNKYLNVRY